MGYRAEATTVEGFVQQLAVAYVQRGYVFYVTGRVPERKDPAAVDAKLLAKYGIDVSRWARARRKRAGLANHHYIRFGRFFVLLATPGEGKFFTEEAGVFRDARRVPVKFGGYAIGYSGGHVRVRIEKRLYRDLKAYFLDLATRRSAEALAAEFRRYMDFQPYAPVRSQCLAVLRAVNRCRAAAGLGPVPNCFRTRRRIVKPFEPGTSDPND
jgi:hypothetical protein